jgi:hypothetical protein
MNIKAFFVDALGGALELGIGTPEDVLRHITPDILATHLPRPLWARLLTAMLGAPRVDARLIVETIGVANLCEHVPAQIVGGCIAELGARSIGQEPEVTAPSRTQMGRVIPPPPSERSTSSSSSSSSASSSVITSAAPVSIGPSIPAPAPTAAVDQPLADVITELEQDEQRNLRPRTATGSRFRQSSTQSGRTPLGSGRRPQAAATPASPIRTPRRTGTDVVEPEPETRVEGDWRGADIPVDDSQLVDWQADGTTAQAQVDDDFTDLGRKR